MVVRAGTQVDRIGPGDTSNSLRLYEEARRYSPQGVHGEGKYYPPYPHFWQRAAGARLWDVDGNEYIDYWGAAGPAILGHNHPVVREAVKRVLDDTGVLFCAPYPGELELAKLIRKHVPGAEMSGYGCGGSDAIVFALRAARAYTGRSKIVRFEGSYHGWYDAVLFSGSPPASKIKDDHYTPIPDSAGLPPDAIRNVLVGPYNDADRLEQVVTREKDDIAAIIVEPISHTMGVVEPQPGFLERARQLCDAHGIVLVFDEIITGFRHSLGGAQGLLRVTPDLTAFGKAMSNGFPISAVSGKQVLMDELTSQGKAYFSGTFNGNPLCVSAAMATLGVLERDGVHERLFRLGGMIAEGINSQCRRHGVRVHCLNYGSVWSVYFTDRPIRNYRDIVRHHNREASQAFVHAMWRKGFYSKPKMVNRWYISAAHTEEDILRTVQAVGEFLSENETVLQ